MKQLILLLVSLVFVTCNSSSTDSTLVSNPHTASTKAKKVLMPFIEMRETTYNFGEMEQGESVTHDFFLKNTGEADLVIIDAKGSCGCTVPEWPRIPIKKGEERTVKVTFNSAGKKGKQNKTVTLVTNAIPNTKVLTIIGNVIVPQKK